MKHLGPEERKLSLEKRLCRGALRAHPAQLRRRYVASGEQPDINSINKLLQGWFKAQKLLQDWAKARRLQEDGVSGELVKEPEYKELQPYEQNLN